MTDPRSADEIRDSFLLTLRGEHEAIDQRVVTAPRTPYYILATALALECEGAEFQGDAARKEAFPDTASEAGVLKHAEFSGVIRGAAARAVVRVQATGTPSTSGAIASGKTVTGETGLVYLVNESGWALDGAGNGFLSLTARDAGAGHPALHARLFMHYCALRAEAGAECGPLALIEHGQAQTRGVMGSSTVLVATLQAATIRVAHVGDCGLLLVRGGAGVFRTTEQQHSFNFPYQLGGASRSRPSDAQTATVPVAVGDIIVAGSDGLFDNLFDFEIAARVLAYAQRAARTGTLLTTAPAALAEELVVEARDAAFDRRRSTPFEKRAVEAEIFYEGGKPDDICAVVAVVTEAEDSPDRR